MKKTKFLLFPLLLSALVSCDFSISTDSSVSVNLSQDPIQSISSIDDSVSESQDSSYSEVFDSESNVSKSTDTDVYQQGDSINTNGASYLLRGNYTDIKITAAKNSEIYIYLDNATITSSSGIAFASENKITLHLILVENSVNTIKNDYEAAEGSETNAIHIKGDLIISGSGTLNVESTSKNAIKASKNLIICEGTTINAIGANHAITAQAILCKGATVNATAKDKDGLNAETDGEIDTFTTEQGYIYLENTNLTIDAYGDGIQASTYITISGGTTNITTHEEFIAYSASLISSGEYTSDDFKFKYQNGSYVRQSSDGMRSYSGLYAFVRSCKGIKVSGVEYEDSSGNTKEVTSGDYQINIQDLATLNITSGDDCIHSNYGEVNLNSSNITVASRDDGIHADYDLNINNCSIIVTSSYEGLEGSNVTLNGSNSNLVIYSSDDGINAASDYGTTHNIIINEGYIRINAQGDGVDANSNLTVNGGTVIIEGPGSGNGSLDSDRVFIKGGTIFACSTNGMLESISATQPTFIYSQSSSFSKGSKISITDSSSNVLFSYEITLTCSQIIFSCSSLTVGKSYKLLNGTTTVSTINLTSTLTEVSSGSSGGGGGGGGNPGGGGGPGGRW